MQTVWVLLIMANNAVTAHWVFQREQDCEQVRARVNNAVCVQHRQPTPEQQIKKFMDLLDHGIDIMERNPRD